MSELTCRICGGVIDPNGGYWKGKHIGAVGCRQSLQKEVAALREKVAALEAVASVAWTDKPPTEPGAYYHYHTRWDRLTVVEVYVVDTGKETECLCYGTFGAYSYNKVSDLGGLWAKAPMPEKPTAALEGQPTTQGGDGEGG